MKKRNILRAVISWLAVAVCMAAIFSLSAQDGEESSELSGWLMKLLDIVPQAGFIVRKCAHALEYMLLAVLMLNALHATGGRFRPVLSFMLTAAYAATDEFHQLFVDGRAGSFADVLIDSAGAATGIIAVTVLVAGVSKIRRKER